MEDRPELNIESIRAVHHDGLHNAFTDLCRYRGRLFLTFRSCPDGHGVFPSSRIVVMVSDDGEDWAQIHSFSVRDRDVRDPHFLVFGERLFVYTGTWLCDANRPPRDLNDHLGFAAWTDDGSNWDGPLHLEGTLGHYIWRAATWDNRAWLCGRRKRGYVHWTSGAGGPEIVEAALLESDDGFTWRTAGLFAETCGNETAFVFDESGAVTAIVRGSGPAWLCRSQPPFDTWQRVTLAHHIGGPMLVRWGDRLLVGGRRMRADSGPVTALYWLEGDHLIDAGELPSGGDNSYPGFVAFDDAHGLLSYYSSHESGRKSQSTVYLANLSPK